MYGLSKLETHFTANQFKTGKAVLLFIVYVRVTDMRLDIVNDKAKKACIDQILAVCQHACWINKGTLMMTAR